MHPKSSATSTFIGNFLTLTPNPIYFRFGENFFLADQNFIKLFWKESSKIRVELSVVRKTIAGPLKIATGLFLFLPQPRVRSKEMLKQFSDAARASVFGAVRSLKRFQSSESKHAQIYNRHRMRSRSAMLSGESSAVLAADSLVLRAHWQPPVSQCTSGCEQFGTYLRVQNSNGLCVCVRCTSCSVIYEFGLFIERHHRFGVHFLFQFSNLIWQM